MPQGAPARLDLGVGLALTLKFNFDGTSLRHLARQTRDAGQARQFLAPASIYDGGSRADAFRVGSVTIQIVRDWVVRLNDWVPTAWSTVRIRASLLS